MTTAQDQQSRAEFEAWARRACYEVEIHDSGQYARNITEQAWQSWKAARALPAPENIREGEPYDDPAFEEIARTMGVWGTAQSALCAQFFLAGGAAQERAPLTDKRIQEIDDETHFHESPGWPVRFARAVEAELRKVPTT